MLAWTAEGQEKLQALYDVVLEEEDEEPEAETASEIKNLTPDEIDCLERLVGVLKNNRDTDPKYRRVLEILKNGVNTEGGWKSKGCIVFSQYFDSANYVAELLSKDLADTPIGLYAGGDKSGIYLNGVFTKEDKDELKAMVKSRQLYVLIGTDAASEGLNLQALWNVILIELCW